MSDPIRASDGTYICIAIQGTTIRFKKFSTIEKIESDFIALVNAGWSTNSAAARAGLNSINFTKFLRVRPKALEVYLEYINRHEKPEEIIYE